MRIGARPTRDHALVQIVDAALADATQRSGHWLACRPGCTQCCMGPFPINQLDAARLQNGLRDLEERAPERVVLGRILHAEHLQESRGEVLALGPPVVVASIGATGSAGRRTSPETHPVRSPPWSRPETARWLARFFPTSLH